MTLHKDICPFCNSANFTKIFSQSDLRFFPKDIFHICRCKNCNILFTLPILSLEQLKKYYPKSYGAYLELNKVDAVFKQAITDYKRWYFRILLFMERVLSRNFYKEIWARYPKKIFYLVSNSIIRLYYKILALITFKYAKFLNPLRIFGLAKYPSSFPYIKKKLNYLHIGSGNAKFFAKLLNLGFSVHNIDINKILCEEYNKKGINSHCGTIEDIDFPDSHFDLIYSTHVIEHLLNPKRELVKLRKWLKQDGVIICHFPLYGTVEWNSSKNSVFFDVPRHRIHMEQQNIKSLFSLCGLRIRKRLNPPYGWGLFFTDYLKIYKQTGKIIEEHLTSKYFKKSLMLSFSKQSGNGWYYLTRK